MTWMRSRCWRRGLFPIVEPEYIKNDTEAIRADWEAVGKDLAGAMNMKGNCAKCGKRDCTFFMQWCEACDSLHCESCLSRCQKKASSKNLEGTSILERDYKQWFSKKARKGDHGRT